MSTGMILEGKEIVLDLYLLIVCLRLLDKPDVGIVCLIELNNVIYGSVVMSYLHFVVYKAVFDEDRLEYLQDGQFLIEAAIYS
jgi:hypothetical protein